MKFPRNFALWGNLAYSLEQQGRFPEAITARERQVDLDSCHARDWWCLAQDYKKNGDDINAPRAAQQPMANFSVFATSDQDSIRSFFRRLG